MKKNIFNICDVAYITRKTIISAFIVLLFAGIVGMAATAETSNRAANIKSKGVFEYNDYQVVFDASDLTYLADEIDLLEDTYKTETVNALNDIGTYYMTDGTVTHNSNSDILAPENSSVLSFNAIKDGIEKSQSIPTDRTYSGMLPGTDEEITDNISAATAENLTLGTAAWVDGELIVGTGGDNNSYYNQGKQNMSVQKLGPYKTEVLDANGGMYPVSCTSVSGYNELNDTNFIVCPVETLIGNYQGSERLAYWGGLKSVSHSYNSYTGILTVYWANQQSGQWYNEYHSEIKFVVYIVA